jgi:hypothetical protein
MTLPSFLKTTLYYSLLIMSCLVGVYFSYIHLNEFIDRISGQTTIFSQISWLTDYEAIFYSAFSGIIFITLLTINGYKIYQKNIKTVTIVCITILLIAIASIFLETLFYNKPV